MQRDECVLQLNSTLLNLLQIFPPLKTIKSMDSSLSINEAAAAGAKDKLPTTAPEEEAAKLHLQRAQWLRAAILGANDGLLSTASLMLGIGAAAREDQVSMIISGVAGALAGACSMATGEFVSVSTQRDIQVSLARKFSPETESSKDVESGRTESNSATAAVLRTPTTNQLVKSIQLSPYHVASPSRSGFMKGMGRDHVRATSLKDDCNKEALPNPYKAAAASCLAFLFGSFVPIGPAMMVVQNRTRVLVIMVVTSIALALSGGFGAFLGGSPIRRSAMRVLFGGWISMAITYSLLMAFDRDHNLH